MSPKPLKSNYPNTGNAINYDKLKKTGWQETGMLVVNRDAPGLTWDQIFMIDQLGNALYGERNKV